MKHQFHIEMQLDYCQLSQLPPGMAEEFLYQEWQRKLRELVHTIGEHFAPIDITEPGCGPATGKRLSLVVMDPEEYHKTLYDARADSFRRGLEQGRKDTLTELREKAYNMIREFLT